MRIESKFINQTVGPFPLRGQAGMTLIEVVIALAITGLIVAGLVTGYIFTSASTIKDSLYTAANARASERLEETRSAVWAPYRSVPVDDLVATNFPVETNVVLDLSASGGQTTYATVQTSISQISTNPPIRDIHVDCIWQFQGVMITNSIETCRAPDQ